MLKRAATLSAVSLAALAGVATRGSADQTVPNPPSAVPPPIVIPVATASDTVVATSPTPVPTSLPTRAPAPAGPDPTPVAVRPTPVAPSEAPRQPNVILVTIDSLRADRIGAYGFAPARTPTLDQIAREGIRFDRAICQLPQTNPSHASLMTGLYASTNGVKIHMVDTLKAGSQTIASVFARAGYQTAGIYSWVSLDPQFCGLNQGFESYQGYVLNRGAVFGNPALEQLAATYRQLKAQVPIVKTADVALGASSDFEAKLDGRADVTNAAALAWLDAHALAAPFFLWVHYYDPHYPYAPPSGFDHLNGLNYAGSINGSVDTIHRITTGALTPNAADRARLEELYQGEVAFTDTQLGNLIRYLRARKLLDDTILVVTGDHGESFGEHGDWTHGLKVYESEIRVPLLLRYPRRLATGGGVAAPVQLIDVMPTLLDLAGLRAAKAVQGTSLLPLISGAADTARVAFTELADESFVSVLTVDDWKLIRNDANDELQLYRLDADEAEQRNLVAAEPRVTANLHARLLDLMKVSGVTR